MQLEAVFSQPITCFLGEETKTCLTTTSFQVVVESDKISPEPPFLQAKQPRFPQLLLIRVVSPHRLVESKTWQEPLSDAVTNFIEPTVQISIYRVWAQFKREKMNQRHFRGKSISGTEPEYTRTASSIGYANKPTPEQRQSHAGRRVLLPGTWGSAGYQVLAKHCVPPNQFHV